MTRLAQELISPSMELRPRFQRTMYRFFELPLSKTVFSSQDAHLIKGEIISLFFRGNDDAVGGVECG
jgi:hypothetical protein